MSSALGRDEWLTLGWPVNKRQSIDVRRVHDTVDANTRRSAPSNVVEKSQRCMWTGVAKRTRRHLPGVCHCASAKQPKLLQQRRQHEPQRHIELNTQTRTSVPKQRSVAAEALEAAHSKTAQDCSREPDIATERTPNHTRHSAGHLFVTVDVMR